MTSDDRKSKGAGAEQTAAMVAQWCSNILDAIYDGVLVADASTVVRYVNPEYTRITGVRSEQIVGRPLREVRPGAILPDVIRTGIPRAGVFRREGDIEYVVDMAPIVRGGVIVSGAYRFSRTSPKSSACPRNSKNSSAGQIVSTRSFSTHSMPGSRSMISSE